MRELKIRTVCVVGVEIYNYLGHMRFTLDHPSPDEDSTNIIFVSYDDETKSEEDYLGLQIVKEIGDRGMLLWEVIS